MLQAFTRGKKCRHDFYYTDQGTGVLYLFEFRSDHLNLTNRLLGTEPSYCNWLVFTSDRAQSIDPKSLSSIQSGPFDAFTLCHLGIYNEIGSMWRSMAINRLMQMEKTDGYEWSPVAVEVKLTEILDLYPNNLIFNSILSEVKLES